MQIHAGIYYSVHCRTHFLFNGKMDSMLKKPYRQDTPDTPKEVSRCHNSFQRQWKFCLTRFMSIGFEFQ